jgi:hypothetical protein
LSLLLRRLPRPRKLQPIQQQRSPLPKQSNLRISLLMRSQLKLIQNLLLPRWKSLLQLKKSHPQMKV